MAERREAESGVAVMQWNQSQACILYRTRADVQGSSRGEWELLVDWGRYLFTLLFTTQH